MTESPKNRGFYTTTQAARILSVAPDTVLKWVKAGKIMAHRTLGGHFRIPYEEIQPLLPEKTAVAEPAPKPALTDHQFCWEHMARDGAIRDDCRECIAYRSRAHRCYELRDQFSGIGCLRTSCFDSCEDCGYYQLINGKGIGVLIISENMGLLRDPENKATGSDISFRFSKNEYDCSLQIGDFRPDYVVLDGALGSRRIATICESIWEDARLPVPRIILTSGRKKNLDYCNGRIIGWIRRPFSVAGLKEYIRSISEH